MNAPLYHKIEIAFWDILIDFLSQSPTAHFLIRKYVEIRRSRYFKVYLGLLAMVGLSGFILGIALPQLLSILP